MRKVRHQEDRGKADYGWLKTAHTFSFAHYYDEAHMGFRHLRVINEDHVAPKTGFEEHGHRDMEILTYVLSGTVEHRDSEGNIGHIRAGMVQRMTAGTGIRHSEMNNEAEPLHLLQIWILPERRGLIPGYEERAFPKACGENRLQLLASPDGREDSLTIHQDVTLWGSTLTPGTKVEHDLAPGRHAWVQVARGTVDLGEQTLQAGDGMAISEEQRIEIQALEQAEVLLFDLA